MPSLGHDWGQWCPVSPNSRKRHWGALSATMPREDSPASHETVWPRMASPPEPLCNDAPAMPLSAGA
eukprot:11367082-Alexandrium_andersonii.AAC.1